MSKLKRISVSLMIAVLCLGILPVGAPLSVAAAEGTSITILHTNDSHGRVEEGKYDGMGFAKLATFVNQERASNPNTLLLDAGDTFHGTPFATLENGNSIAKIFNHLKYDGLAAGNHDFNYGQDRLVEIANNEVDFPVISANVRIKETNEQLLKTHFIKEIDGVKIGVFGLSTPETHYKTNPKNVEGLEFTDIVEEGKAMVSKLQAENVDVIIALTHLGVDASSTDTSIKLAEGAPGIDLIVDGHSHTVDNLDKNGNKTKIVSAGEYTKNLGKVVLTFDAEKNLTGMEAARYTKEDAASIEPDTETEALINTIKDKQDVIMSEVIGSSDVLLHGERGDVRTSETNLGNLITNAMMEKTNADLAITNGGGIRSSIQKGEVTLGDVINVSPFGNYLVTKKMDGKTIKAALEHGVSDYPNTKGAFPHVAGISFTIDSRTEGERVKNLMVGDQPIDMNKMYTVATNDFLSAGGDDYGMLKDTELINEYSALEEVMKEYFKSNSPIKLGDENRINIHVPFKDISRDDWGFDHVEKLYGHKIINGMSENVFGTQEPVTRVQFASLLTRTLGLEASGEANFTDMHNVYGEMRQELAAAEENGLIKGYHDNTFKPHKEISRGEMAIILDRAYDLKAEGNLDQTDDAPFNDIADTTEEMIHAINDMHDLGILIGMGNDKFMPRNDATRQEGAKALDLFIQATE
ncbi:5'-nucleotidase C-terminal domain-containing protein [Paraliobacillus salinarum]|uniref:5'-nucleotidase C-terminal domain-containing protein n=1 Tax=Paraliobacillus salinarum TaxID=1158996 RepID=UPI0015F77E94|nr:5'-nucleotidase C-terminal domain-containing protein [Paraliobacillus salinarum]